MFGRGYDDKMHGNPGKRACYFPPLTKAIFVRHPESSSAVMAASASAPRLRERPAEARGNVAHLSRTRVWQVPLGSTLC